MRLGTLALLAALLAAPCGFAEQLPSRARGLAADSVYQLGDLDNINLFNGNLGIAIPIGQSYGVSPQLSYRLALAYNSSVWDYEDELFCLDIKNQQRIYNFPYPAPSSNAGVGWSLHLGRLYAPQDDIYNKHNPNWLYVSPEGGQHNFYAKLHPTEATVAGVFYSNDSTYLRLDARDPSRLEVESQDGLVRTFSLASGRYRLTETADRFGNWMRVTYGVTSWEITDSHGRSHTLTLNAAGDVTQVELEAFAGNTATYRLSYNTVSLERHRFDRQCDSANPLHTEFVTANLLGGLELPDGSDFAFTYDTTDSSFTGFSGAIRSMVVPTGGRFEWDYTTYAFQSQAPTLPESTITQQRGVGARRTYLQSSGGPVHGSWTYEQTDSYAVTLPGGPFQAACWHRTRVSDHLSQQVTESYFATAGGSSRWWYGLPYAPCDPETSSTTFTAWSESNAEPHLSTRVYEKQSGGTLVPVRSTYVIYDSDGRDAGNRQDRNNRLRYQKIVYHDDLDSAGNPHQEEAIHADFDGLGHYRSVSRRSSFGLDKTVVTSFLPAGSYQLSPDTSSVLTDSFSTPNIASPWIHGLSSGSTTTQGSRVSKRETCYDGTTGFLRRLRSLAGSNQQGNDVIVDFEKGDDQDGNGGFVVGERVYGGDAQALATNVTLCDVTLPLPSYVKKSAYQYGSLQRSAWVEPCDESAEILVTEEAQIDPSTGLPQTVVEPNGLEVQLEYDNMGRLLAEVPEEGASRTHKYMVSPPSYEIRHCPQGTSNFCPVSQRLSDRYWSYDALGRMASKALAYPGENGDAQPSVTYKVDGIGRKTEESTWGGVRKTEFKDFDVFGRATTIEPDGTHATLLSFRGARIKTREVKVATSQGGTQSVFNTEQLDHHGRLTAVCEAATEDWDGVASCTGQLTRYGYDQDDRLIHVCQNVQPNGTCGQQRAFGWDGRGFMTSETHPEIGAAGNGTIVYQRDARGNPTHRDVLNDAGDRPLAFTYDRAGRTIRVEERISTGWRPIKEFFYARSNPPGGSEKRRGQLIMARRTNWVELLNPLPVEVAGVPLIVTDHYEYAGLGGRVSKKTTSITLPSGGQSFTSRFTHGPLGDLAGIEYPSGDWPYQAPERQINYTRRLGFLTGIPGYASAITYQLGGMLNEIQYANNLRWRQSAEVATGWERTGKIETLNAANHALWSTGDYNYDGSGNISTIGDRSYVYDAFSRFSYVQKAGQIQREQQATYDPYGNLTALAKNGNTRTLTTSASTNRLSTPDTLYTSNGELAQAFIDGLRFVYGYDGLGQQLFQQTTAKTWVYAYDANDERVLTWECAGNRCGDNTNFERYTLRGLSGEVLRVFEGPGRASLAWKEDFIYRDNEPLGWVQADEAGEKRLFLHADHLGSIRHVTGATGLQVSRHDFLPFGEESTLTTGGDVALKFTGHERDQPGKPLDYMHARFHSPNLGRFLSIDPVIKSGAPANPQLWNRYTYTANNPLGRRDPDGRNWFDVQGKWEWHQGSSYTDSNGKVYSSDFTHLLVVEQTGTSNGVAQYDMTLYSQDKVLIRAKAFSGGHANGPIPDGTYTIRGDIQDPKGPDIVNPHSPDHNPPQYFGMQVIRTDYLKDPKTGISYDVFAAYGPMRARLIPWDKGNPKADGNYLHGQSLGGSGTTHGCLCYGQDTAVIDYLWKLGARVPVTVNGRVSKP